MKAIIFANGEFSPPVFPLEIQKDDLVIAADGGSRHCLELGITPEILIGDLDSVDEETMNTWQKDGISVIQYPQDKDQTDLELALIYAQEKNVDEILIYGAIGGRLDMTLGNLILLAHPDLKTPTALICGAEEVRLLKPGDSLIISGQTGDTVSLIPMQPGISNVTTTGLKYKLENEGLEFSYTRGISNSLIEKQAQIKLNSGLMAVVQIRN